MSASLVGSEMCIRDSTQICSVRPPIVGFDLRIQRAGTALGCSSREEDVFCLLYTSDAADDM
eukprot:9770955-Alexandrium_andersonii.AAC.1